jgi:hypothetical protein
MGCKFLILQKACPPVAGKERDFIPAPHKLIKQPLQHSPAGERSAGAIADNQVVQQPYIDQVQGRPDPPGDALVGLAGLRDAGGMIVRDNQYILPMPSHNVPNTA